MVATGNLPELLTSVSVRVATVGLSLASLAAGFNSMRTPPDVSTWANMQIVTSTDPVDGTDCANLESVSGVSLSFVDTEGQIYEPAVRIGTEAVFPSFRLLERDIGGTFHAQFSNLSGQSIPLADFTFAEAYSESVLAGCRVSLYTVTLNEWYDPALKRLESLVNSSTAPTQWTLTQSVDIADGHSETWASEEFWIVPRAASGQWLRNATSIHNPFIGAD